MNFGAQLPKRRQQEDDALLGQRYPVEPKKTFSYFLENAPLLELWQREIIRIVRKISQYFTRKTNAGNERRLGDLLALHHPQLRHDEGTE